MKELEERIISEGKVLEGRILQVGSFLNQQIDTALIKDLGEEISRLFADDNVTKILTIEASGISIATAAGVYLGVPVVFAKKNRTSNVSGEVYVATVYSFTNDIDNRIVVSKEFLNEGDRILIVDDFLAHGSALNGLIAIVKEAGATVVGCAVAIEKGFQGGGDSLRARGYRVESLANIEEMSEDEIIFR